MSKKLEALNTRIATAEAALAKLIAQRAALETQVDVAEGDVVSYKFGRGDKVVEKTGKVLGVKLGGNGATLVVIETGSGINKQIDSVPATAITGKASASLTAAVVEAESNANAAQTAQ